MTAATPFVSILLAATIATIATTDTAENRMGFNEGLDNDVAVIKIKPNVAGQYIRYNEVIQPIRLPEEGMELNDGMYCYVLGWGGTHLKNSKGRRIPAKRLQGAKVPVINATTCANRPEYVAENITENMFCAGNLGEGGGHDSCYGDSGGPFACKFKGTFHLMGVVSFGNGGKCGQEGHPGIYTKLTNYVDWLRNATTECHSVVVETCTAA